MAKQPKVIAASVFAGVMRGLQNRSLGFDSRRRLHSFFGWRYHPEWSPSYTFRDGKRLGPFLFSTSWTNQDEHSRAIFGDDLGEAARSEIKNAARNKGFVPPRNPIHLAREVIKYLRTDRDKWREQAIAARKEVTKLKRLRSDDDKI